jgi:acyl-CoA synthetase (AMP-forming)/AMP-acid ligase II
MLMDNCREFIEIDLALSKTGIVRVPLNAKLTGNDHEYILNDSDSSLLIYGEEHAKVVASIEGRLSSVKKFIKIFRSLSSEQHPPSLDYDELIAKNSADDPGITISENDLHTLFYTSGTTGLPKGVMLTQKSWANVVVNLVTDYAPIEEDDVLLNTQLLSHGAGFFVLPFFIRGATNVLIPQFNTDAVFKTIEKEKVTVLKLVPVMLFQLMDSPEKERFDLSSLKAIIYGGSPIAPHRLIEALKLFGPKLIQLYGQAEAPMCISFLSKRNHVMDGSPEVVHRLSSAGQPCTNVEVRIVDDQGRDVPPGTFGEIIVRGYHIFIGYWKKPEETAKTLKDGWVYTGDIGCFDSRGFIFLVDRKKDMIISGAFNIYPREIEDVIVAHPKVKEVAVIGVPDERWGEAVKAVVVPQEGARVSHEEIIEFCKERLAGFKKPKSVDFMHQLPRNPYGKVLKIKLREPYWEGIERRIH